MTEPNTESKDNREAMIEAAKKYGEQNRVEGGNGWALMADFTIQQIALDRQRIAADLTQIAYAPLNKLDQPQYKLARYIDKLKAEAQTHPTR